MKVTHERRTAMKFIQLPTEAEGYEEVIRESINLRLRANKMKDEAKSLEVDANDLFRGVAEAAGFDAVETDKGTIRIVNKAGAEKLDKAKLKDALIKAGVDSGTVVASFKKATTQGEDVVYVGFFPPKGA